MKKILVLLLCLGLVGCASVQHTKKLRQISLGMSKDEVMEELGEPSVVRGAITNKFNQTVEVWEYRMDKGKTGKRVGAEVTATLVTFGILAPVLFSSGEIQDYWLYFYDNKLVQWGQAGDWKAEADRIYEFNFNPSEKLTR